MLTLSMLFSNTYGQNKATSKNPHNPGDVFLSLQWIGFTIHPKGSNNPEVYKLKLDDGGNTTLQLGVAANLDYTFASRWLVRASIAYYADCRLVPSGYFHIGPRLTLLRKGNHSFLFGVGPSLYFREDWHQFPEYGGDSFYGDRVSGKWQYRFLIYGGEIDYIYNINSKLDLHYSMVPGYPHVLTSKIGFRIKL